MAGSQYFFLVPPVVTLLALGALTASIRGRKLLDIHVYGAFFVAGIAFFFLRKLLGNQLGLAYDLIAIAGNATCGWSWLLSRALFRRPGTPSSLWPVGVVVAQTLAGAILQFSGGSSGPLLRMVDNGQMLLSATVLLLAIAEPLRGFRRDMPQGEQRFRLAFAIGQAALVTISTIWIGGAPAGSLEAQWGDMVKIGCATVALVGAGLAIWYRSRMPVPEVVRVKRRVVSADDEGLSARILALMNDEAVYTVSSLKVSDLARRVNEAEYKVTQCITGTLGFRNFNHMINHFRIEQAAQMLADPAYDHLPVLTIALDCGFGSIGPFNRAFKAQSGDTPTAYREARRTTQAA